jgi:prepilin-type N-terminal cleavage/methylation domain-containing protein
MTRRGYSLIELLTALAIGSVITAAIVTLLLGQMQLSSSQNRTMLNGQNLRDTLDYMAEEISVIGHNVQEPYISIAAANDFQFVTDIDGDGNWNRIRYDLNGTNLRRRLWTSTNQGVSWTLVSTDNILRNISAFTFEYYQPGNTTTTVLNDITLVNIKITQNPAGDTTAFNTGHVPTGRLALRTTIRNRLLD